MWKAVLCVFIGSGLGGVIRYLTAVGMEQWGVTAASRALPWSTLTVNIIGCFIFGMIFGLSLNNVIGKEWRLALTTGFCGGLTTFSTFSFETFAMITDGHVVAGIAYSLLSMFLGLAAAWAGYALAR